MPESNSIWNARDSCYLFGCHDGAVRGPSNIADLMVWEREISDYLEKILRRVTKTCGVKA